MLDLSLCDPLGDPLVLGHALYVRGLRVEARGELGVGGGGACTPLVQAFLGKHQHLYREGK